MSENGYWKNGMNRRISRRRAMGGALGAAAGAGALYAAACGKKSSVEPNGGGSKYRMVSLEDTTSKVIPGGTLVVPIVNEIQNWDPHMPSAGGGQATVFGYMFDGLLGNKSGPEHKWGERIREGSAATAWEYADDGMTLRFKLRPGMKFHNVAPVNGRVVDAEDIVVSLKRFLAKSNARNLFADVDAIESDSSKQNVIIKMKQPSAPILYYIQAYLGITPKEIDEKYDPVKVAIGSGPWVVTGSTASVDVKLARHPDYWAKDSQGRPLPYLDGAKIPIMPEYAQRNIQFTAGNLTIGNPLPPDLMSLYNQTEGSVLFQGADFPVAWNAWHYMWGSPKDAPYRDDRVRKAISMLFDRDLINTRIYDTEKLTEAGLEAPSRWHSHLSCGYNDYWLDPKKNELGEVSKYFHRNVAEAKKLLSAAGYPNGFKMDVGYPTGAAYTPIWADMVNLTFEILKDGGIECKGTPLELLTQWMVKVWKYDASGNPTGNWTGMDVVAVPPTVADPDWVIRNYYLPPPEGTQNPMAITEAELGDLAKVCRDQRAAIDPKVRVPLIHEFQKKAAEKMFWIPWYGAAQGYALLQKWVQNVGIWEPLGPKSGMLHMWFDDAERRKPVG